MSERKETKYNKIVNFDEETREITLLDGVFQYEDGFKGATGTTFEPITEEQIQERLEGLEGDDIELLCYYAENFGEVTVEMIRGVDSSREALIELFFDQSYCYLGDYLRESLNLEDIVLFNCIGGGRCFDKDYQGNVNPKLSKVIRKYEAA